MLREDICSSRFGRSYALAMLREDICSSRFGRSYALAVLRDIPLYCYPKWILTQTPLKLRTFSALSSSLFGRRAFDVVAFAPHLLGSTRCICLAHSLRSRDCDSLSANNVVDKFDIKIRSLLAPRSVQARLLTTHGHPSLFPSGMGRGWGWGGRHIPLP